MSFPNELEIGDLWLKMHWRQMSPENPMFAVLAFSGLAAADAFVAAGSGKGSGTGTAFAAMIIRSILSEQTEYENKVKTE